MKEKFTMKDKVIGTSEFMCGMGYAIKEIAKEEEEKRVNERIKELEKQSFIMTDIRRAEIKLEAKYGALGKPQPKLAYKVYFTLGLIFMVVPPIGITFLLLALYIKHYY